MKGVNLNYDKNSDVLYISFSEAKRAICHNTPAKTFPREGVVGRISLENGMLIGFTVANFSLLRKSKGGKR